MLSDPFDVDANAKARRSRNNIMSGSGWALILFACAMLSYVLYRQFGGSKKAPAEPIWVCGSGLEDANGQYKFGGHSNDHPFWLKPTKHKNEHNYIVHVSGRHASVAKLFRPCRLPSSPHASCCCQKH